MPDTCLTSVRYLPDTCLTYVRYLRCGVRLKEAESQTPTITIIGDKPGRLWRSL